MKTDLENKNCIKEIGWWIFKSKEVIHSYKLTAIRKFMDSSQTFHVSYKCKVCGATRLNRFVKKNDLIKMGIPVKELESLTSSDTFIIKHQ